MKEDDIHATLVRQCEYAMVRRDDRTAGRAHTGNVGPCLVLMGWHSEMGVGFISHLDAASAWVGTKQVLDEMKLHVGVDEMDGVELKIVSRVPANAPILMIAAAIAYGAWTGRWPVALLAALVAAMFLLSRISVAIQRRRHYSNIRQPEDLTVWDLKGAFAWLLCQPARLRTGGTIDALLGPEAWNPYATNTTDGLYKVTKDCEVIRLKPAIASKAANH